MLTEEETGFLDQSSMQPGLLPSQLGHLCPRLMLIRLLVPFGGRQSGKGATVMPTDLQVWLLTSARIIGCTRLTHQTLDTKLCMLEL